MVWDEAALQEWTLWAAVDLDKSEKELCSPKKHRCVRKRRAPDSQEDGGEGGEKTGKSIKKTSKY